MPIAQLKEIEIAYDDKGSGVLLILLHAFPADRRIWQAQRDELSSRFRVITLDFPGFGQSSAGGPFTVPKMAEQVHDFVLALSGKSGDAKDSTPLPRELRPVLGGLSMGGYVAMNYAKLFPQDLRGLILCDTKDAGDTSEQRDNRNRMIEVAKSKGASAIAELMLGKLLSPDTISHRPAIAKRMRDIMEACPAETIAHALAALRDRPDMTNALSQIEVPALIIVGEQDAITPPDVARAMQSRMKNAELAIIPGAGHMTSMEQPTLVNTAMEKFLTGLASD